MIPAQHGAWAAACATMIWPLVPAPTARELTGLSLDVPLPDLT